MSLYKNIGKSLNAVGSIGTLASDAIEAVGSSSNIIKEKINSSVEEEKIEQATSRILLRAKSIKKIAEALGCTLPEAEELLEKELNK